jgi:hypothetical protein
MRTDLDRDRHVATLDIASFAQTFAECRREILPDALGSRYPTTDIDGCCDCAVSGHTHRRTAEA